jgi:hypothetical protein
MKRSLSLCVLAVILLVSASSLWAQAPVAGGKRTFYMGFTPFPADISLPALQEMQEFLPANSDIIAQHLEGVPWTEALNGQPFSEHLMNDWKGRIHYLPEGTKVYLAVSPLDGGRADVADYHGTTEHMPLPPEFKGKAFDDPIVRKAYLSYCQRAADFFKPDYMAIGIEVNELFHHSPGKWEAYTRLNHYVYQELKKKYPNMLVFTTFTVHSMLNPQWTDREAMLAAYKGMMDSEDIIAISYYPFLDNPRVDANDAFKWLFSNFDQYAKPYAVGETGESAQPISLNVNGMDVHIEGSPSLQLDYYQALLAAAQKKHFKFVITFLHQDYDALWEKIKASSPAFFVAWRNCGLVDAKGNRRPAYDLWKKYFQMPRP